MTAPLRLTEAPDRLVVHLARPESRNAIDQQMVDALHDVCSRLERDPRIMLLIGDGGNFAAGANIGQLLERGRLEAILGINSGIFDRIRRLPMPTIALLDGHVLGGGAELAYACDFRLSTSRIRIGNPEPGLGIIAAAGATWRLKELVGEPLAKEILLAGRVLNAEESLACRLVTEVVEPEDLLGAGERLADRISTYPPLGGAADQSRLPRPLRGASAGGQPGSSHPVRDRRQAGAHDGVPG